MMVKDRGGTVCAMDHRYCIDNGAMIAQAGVMAYQQVGVSESRSADPTHPSHAPPPPKRPGLSPPPERPRTTLAPPHPPTLLPRSKQPGIRDAHGGDDGHAAVQDRSGR